MIYSALQDKSKSALRWKKSSFKDFKSSMESKDFITKFMTKADLAICFDTYNEAAVTKIHVCKSWPKPRLVDILHEAFNSSSVTEVVARKKKRTRNPTSLVNACKKVIKSFPKRVLNIIISEQEIIGKLNDWRGKSPFEHSTNVGIHHNIVWFSQPEYSEHTLSYMFSFLDVHHLITNTRTKVCKDGLPDRDISKKAWLDVARGNKTNLKISHVEDLIDKQSDAIANETFSKDVEMEMMELGHVKEANFCKLIREFYEAEDEPGLPASERCQRRINLRNWLLEGVKFCEFPPYGSHIRGIPNIMFQGLLTNIERRMQLFPYVKSQRYNVRALGSLEIENFFGEFQDLDPKGSGIIKAEEVPAALESACQLLSTRLLPTRSFHMSLSNAKVYPVKEMMTECQMETDQPYVYPTKTHHINLRYVSLVTFYYFISL